MVVVMGREPIRVADDPVSMVFEDSVETKRYVVRVYEVEVWDTRIERWLLQRL